MKNLLAVSCILVFISCNKVNTNQSQLEGSYVGYFHRNRQDTTQVSLNFSENAFNGKCSNATYPAVGKGAFEQKDNIISFTNSGLWSSNFDKSLILKGDYNYQYNSDGTIRIWRQNKAMLDEYILRRHIR